MAQLPIRFSNVSHLSFATSGGGGGPPKCGFPRFGGLSYYLPLRLCRGFVHRESSISADRFSKCFFMKNSSRTSVTSHSPPRVSTHQIALSISEAKAVAAEEADITVEISEPSSVFTSSVFSSSTGTDGCAVDMEIQDPKNSGISNQEFEREFFKPSVLYGCELENSFMEYVSTLKKGNPTELEPYRSSPVKKEGQIFAALRRSRFFFVTKKIKNSAKKGIRILRGDKHKPMKKVMVRANVVIMDGGEKLWSKPILRGKRCRELPIEEFPYIN